MARNGNKCDREHMDGDMARSWEQELEIVLGEIAGLEAELEALREYAEFCRIAHGLTEP